MINRLGVVFGVALVGLGLSWGVLRYTHFTPASLNPYGFGSDADVYWDLAGNWPKGLGYTSSPGLHPVARDPASPYLPNISTAPGYPFVLGLARLVWDDLRIAYILQGLFYIGLLWMAAMWPLHLPGTPFARWIGLCLIALWPGFLLQLPSISSELGTAFAGVVMVWSLYQFRWWSVFVAALAASAMVAFRSNTILFVIPWLVIHAAIQRYSSGNLRRSWQPLFVIVCIAVMYMGWGMRNKSYCGDRVFSAYLGQVLYTHYIGNTPAWLGGEWSTSDSRESYVRSAVAKGLTWSEAERDLYQELTRFVWQKIQESLGTALFAIGRAWTGFFTDSYFRVPDLLWARAYGLTLLDNRKIDLKDPALSPLSRGLYWFMRGFFLLVRAVILLMFLVAPFFLWRADQDRLAWLNIWVSVFIFLAGTALVSASGDRQLVPVAFFVLGLVVHVGLMPKLQHQ